MQIKLSIVKSLFIVVLLSCTSGVVAAEQSLSGLAEALKETGWSVQQEPDGSLILKPKVSAANNIEGSHIEGSRGAEDNWLTMQRELQAAGWKVSREADGTLVLFPPGMIEVKETRQIHPMLDVTMKQQLKQAGWGILEESDGSLLLYPPAKSDSAQPLASPGVLPVIALSLPVDSWQEAHAISQSWLKQQPSYQATIGKIRKILRIYLVSIVSETSPHTLLQQIAIRSSDGAVIVLN